MPERDDSFVKKLLVTFKIEAEEHLKAMSSGLLGLERTSVGKEQTEIIERVFREAHSLKGAARSVNIAEIETVCQSMENVLAGLKRNEITLSPELFDLFQRAVDSVAAFLLSNESERTADEKSKINTLVRQFDMALKGPEVEVREQAEGPDRTESGRSPIGSHLLSETVRITTAKLDAVLLQAEELLSAKLSAGQRARELREVNTALAVRKKEWARIQPILRIIQRSHERNGGKNRTVKKSSPVIKLLEFIEKDDTFVKSLENKVTSLTLSAEGDHRTQAGMVDNLLEDMKKVLMLPFSSLLEIFPKLVRDLSRDQRKEVELVMQGAEIEMDRRILEEMKDPLIHLVRNAIDHGIEEPAERERKNKLSLGRLTVAVSQKDGGTIEILIADDGAGIEVEKVRTAAVKQGILSPEEAEKCGRERVLSQIFQSGVSTSPIITDLSGRGLGLAIVREKVEKLGGTVSVETDPDTGAAFRMVLPVTLTGFRGILVRLNEGFFVVRTTHVERVGRIDQKEIRTVENRETIQIDGRAVFVTRLEDALELPGKRVAGDSVNSMPLVVLASGRERIAFLVDEILGEQEVLVKPIGKLLSRVRNIAGAAVLGTGKVASVLNVPDLMKSAVKFGGGPVRAAVVLPEEIASKRKSILVAEDSITSRTLVKNILESAGYHVKTVVDGVEAFTALKTEAFDLLVSDVDMPRMSGFDLTARIRSDKKLSELPVVLVTALESREDRERGIDAGANGYIVKSSFDQSNLLEVIRRLI